MNQQNSGNISFYVFFKNFLSDIFNKHNFFLSLPLSHMGKRNSMILFSFLCFSSFLPLMPLPSSLLFLILTFCPLSPILSYRASPNSLSLSLSRSLFLCLSAFLLPLFKYFISDHHTLTKIGEMPFYQGNKNLF